MEDPGAHGRDQEAALPGSPAICVTPPDSNLSCTSPWLSVWQTPRTEVTDVETEAWLRRVVSSLVTHPGCLRLSVQLRPTHQRELGEG